MIGTSYEGVHTITIRVKAGHIEYCANETALNDADGHIVSMGVTNLTEGAELVIVRRNGLLDLEERAGSSVQPSTDYTT